MIRALAVLPSMEKESLAMPSFALTHSKISKLLTVFEHKKSQANA